MTSDPANTNPRAENAPPARPVQRPLHGGSEASLSGAGKKSAAGEPRRDQSGPMKREFILAMGVFVAMAVVGTIFGLWYAINYAPVRP